MRRSDPIYGLSDRLLPIHLKPLPDELMSSWLVRLSHAHGVKVQTMSAILFGQDTAIWNRDIDRLASHGIIEILAAVSGTAIEQIENTTLRGYEGYLFEQHRANGICSWIVPLGIFHRSRRRPGLMFCPQCLREDTHPYFRRRWRLAFSTVCTRHRCDLLDVCRKCEAPIAPHRSDMQGRQVFPNAISNVHCGHCGFDLRTDHTTKVVDKSLVQLQTRLEQALENGYTDWASNPAMHSIVFFEGLRSLIAGMTSMQTQERLTKSMKLSSWPRTGLEMASLSMRRELFQLLAKVLEDWPKKFIEVMHERKLRYADLKGDSKYRTYWYEDTIRREAGGGHALISLDEAEAIASAVEVRHGRFSVTVARALSGRDISEHIPDRLPQPVSDDVYEDLLTSIDHQIASTQDKMERACLIRDKVMFAVGRQLGLSEGALAGLTLDQVRKLAPERAELDFSDVARSPAQARAWVEWYWNNMRPHLHPQSDSCHVFTSSRTRRGYRHSAISLRFKRAVGAAMLWAAIPSFGCFIMKKSSLHYIPPSLSTP